MKTITSESCVDRIKSYLSVDDFHLPVFINVNTSHDYGTLKNTLGQLDLKTIKVSEYCRSDDELPDIEKLFHELQEQEKSILLLGFSQYMKLRGKKLLLTKLATLKDLSVHKCCLFILLYQSEEVLTEILDKDLRLRERIIFVKGEKEKSPKYKIYTSDILDSPFHFRDFLEYLENHPALPVKASTKLSFKLFCDRMIPVCFISTVYDLLLEEFGASKMSQFNESFGTIKEWQYLHSQYKNHGHFEKILSEELGGENLFNLFNNWPSFNKNRKWLYWMCLHVRENNGSYLSLAAIKAKKFADFEKYIFQALLYLSPDDEKYSDYYSERKRLIKALNEKSINSNIGNYIRLTLAKEQRALYYLTDLTVAEKQSILICLDKYDYERNSLIETLHMIYPDLAYYLDPFHTEYEFLNEYFDAYKFQKVTNRIYPDFIHLVDKFSFERNYNKDLPARMTALEKIDFKDADIFFFDALGVEYLSFILAKSKELNLFVDVTICRANLPTITEMNKDFMSLFEDIPSIKLLDEVKHSDEGDFNYNRTKLPIHICRELEIIEQFLNKVRTKLNEKEKVIVISDHGASRLAIIHEGSKSVDLGSKGMHGGRCCVYIEGIKKIDEAVEENGYYVIGNYNKIKGGRINSVETHGGGTLEEVVIPILEFRLNDKEITVYLKETLIKTSYRKEGRLVVISDYKLKHPTLKINDNIILLEKEENYQYHFSLNKLKKPGDYVAKLYDSTNYISDLEFKIVKEGSVEKELF